MKRGDRKEFKLSLLFVNLGNIPNVLIYVKCEEKDLYTFKVNLDHKYFPKNIKNNKSEIINFYIEGLFIPFWIMAFALWKKQKDERILEEILST